MIAQIHLVTQGTDPVCLLFQCSSCPCSIRLVFIVLRVHRREPVAAFSICLRSNDHLQEVLRQPFAPILLSAKHSTLNEVQVHQARKQLLSFQKKSNIRFVMFHVCVFTRKATPAFQRSVSFEVQAGLGDLLERQ